MHSLPREIVCRTFGGKGATAFQRRVMVARGNQAPGRPEGSAKSTWIGPSVPELPLHHVAARG